MKLRAISVGGDKRTTGTGVRAALGFGCLLAFFCVCDSGQASDLFAANMDQLNSSISQAHPGDTVTIASGNWTNADILFKANGAPDQVITLRAQVPGQVFLTGASRLRIAGSYLVVDAGSPIGGTNSIQRWTDDGPVSSPDSARFYRVKQLP